MKKNTVIALLAFVGAIIGYGFAKASNASNFEVITDIILAAFLMGQLGRAFFDKYYSVVIGPIVGLLISIGSDLLAGSEVASEQKLMYMVMGMFAGWPIGKFGKSLLAGGMIGSVIGFIWGMYAGHWFGKAYLQPGILNALLLAIQVAMIGIVLARFLAEMVETKFMTKRDSPS